ncbi:hypothetical protein JQU21_20470 [Ponticoccus sp. SC6-42]|nr:hypothetical protein [Ponticoccus sp. SC6-9]MBM1249577.1 hypothetical protein [Ponticoccus sp. SC6-42]MBM1346065.1 hypothetical protein [Ponticoccus sp. SC2-56]
MNDILMNFNIPKDLKSCFDEISRRKHISKTAILIDFIERYCRKELKALQEDQELRQSVTENDHSSDNRQRTSDWIPPVVPRIDLDQDWDEEFRL